MDIRKVLCIQLVALVCGPLVKAEPRASSSLVPPAMAQTRTYSSYEEYPSDPVGHSSTNTEKSAFVKSPTSWFLPNLKKWPRFPMAFGRAPAASADYTLPDEIEDDVKRGASSQWLPSFMGTSAKNLRVDMHYMDEMHPRYTPIKNQRLLKVLG
ncbi:hypothetical protein RvY_10209 [Ramazzottius varieornatus]|uniref:Uncharacterized protein n=1 Tax=Ramazzottius varieornatus TaxID=947166 RepID=A0A1D1VJS6_RAMVA|nr:hypothetical protein RvY_10209 [Ramazzottius varieornatus]